MSGFHTSVMLDAHKCNGCINCLKRCPTDAIRVHKGKAAITSTQCIDCGECIRICPYHAKKSRVEKFEKIQNFDYKIAVPDQAVYGQFRNLKDLNIILTGLKRLGFDDVMEVAAAAEYETLKMREYVEQNSDKWPLISTACPTVVRLISIKFPSLIEHLLPVVNATELAAFEARRRAVKATGLAPEKIGVFAISPCPAKITARIMPIGLEKSNLDGVFSIKDIYPDLLNKMNSLGDDIEDLSKAGRAGIRWGATSGEAIGLMKEGYIAADGIENVIRLLEKLEDEEFSELKFAELNACNGGCLGGVLNVENPYLARAKIISIRHDIDEFKYDYDMEDKELEEAMKWTKDVEYTPVFELSPDIKESIIMKAKVEELTKSFPGLDCGGCGAPSCRAFATDIVTEKEKHTDCPLKDSFEQLEGSYVAKKLNGKD